MQVKALDSDDGKNRVLKYSIVSGNSLGRFFIDASSGILYVKSALDRDAPRNEDSFTLTVTNQPINQQNVKQFIDVNVVCNVDKSS